MPEDGPWSLPKLLSKELCVCLLEVVNFSGNFTLLQFSLPQKQEFYYCSCWPGQIITWMTRTCHLDAALKHTTIPQSLLKHCHVAIWGIKSCKLYVEQRKLSADFALLAQAYAVCMVGELGAVSFAFSFRNSMMKISKQIWGMRMTIYITLLKVW